MNWLQFLKYVPLIFESNLVQRVQSAWNTATSGTAGKVEAVVQALAPDFIPMLAQVGSSMWPQLAPAIQAAAAAVVSFHPDAVRWMQDALNHAGASPQLAVDGHFGPRTLAAVKAFQTSHGIPVTGWIDDLETKLLQSLLPA